MLNTPAVTTNTSEQNQESGGYHETASWYAKRLVLRLQLAQQVQRNEKSKIDTSVIAYDLTDNKQVYSHNVNYEHYAASVSKLFITSLLLDDLKTGKTTLSTTVKWDASDRRDGAGVYDAVGAPT